MLEVDLAMVPSHLLLAKFDCPGCSVSSQCESLLECVVRAAAAVMRKLYMLPRQ